MQKALFLFLFSILLAPIPVIASLPIENSYTGIYICDDIIDDMIKKDRNEDELGKNVIGKDTIELINEIKKGMETNATYCCKYSDNPLCGQEILNEMKNKELIDKEERFSSMVYKINIILAILIPLISIYFVRKKVRETRYVRGIYTMLILSLMLLIFFTFFMEIIGYIMMHR